MKKILPILLVLFAIVIFHLKDGTTYQGKEFCMQRNGLRITIVVTLEDGSKKEFSVWDIKCFEYKSE